MSARRKVVAAVGVAAVAGAAVALSQYVPPNERGREIVVGEDLSGSLVGAGPAVSRPRCRGGRRAIQLSSSEEGQPAAAEVAGSAPISDALREQARTAIDAISTAS